MKLLAKLLAGAFWVVLVFSLVQAAETKNYYTKVNIWYEKPEKILSTNYHRGAIIPYGSKVSIVKQAKEKISFTVEGQQGMTYVLTNIPRHSLVSAQALIGEYFSETDPKAKGGEFDKFSPKEKENIQNGTLAEGMSKEAVLAAYGIPPKHRTPALTSDLWNYWDSRYIRKQLTFKNNKLSSIEEITEAPGVYYVP